MTRITFRIFSKTPMNFSDFDSEFGSMFSGANEIVILRHRILDYYVYTVNLIPH
jgi:hypothetical protein